MIKKMTTKDTDDFQKKKKKKEDKIRESSKFIDSIIKYKNINMRYDCTYL